jgi:hypothetical protein
VFFLCDGLAAVTDGVLACTFGVVACRDSLGIAASLAAVTGVLRA